MKNNLLIIFCLICAPIYSTNPLYGLLERIDKGASAKMELVLSNDTTSSNFFHIESDCGKIKITTSDYASMGMGINWYLKYVAGVQPSWNNGLKVKLPEVLPTNNLPIYRTANHSRRYYLNYCTYGYSMPFWDWERWEQELDWMILHGINQVLLMTGLENVWDSILKRLGYSTDEVNDFLCGPAFLPWWAMNNLQNWGGPLTSHWHQQQAQLKDSIIQRMHDFHIDPVLPGYAGMLPSNAGEKLGVNTTDPGLWCGFQRPAFLLPTDNAFDSISSIYYEELTNYYGIAKYYSIDPFHEGGSSAGVNLNLAGQKIMEALKKCNPEAVWVIQAWQDNPRMEMISGLEQHDVEVLDLWCESRPQWGEQNSLWYRPDGFGKHDWLYCNVLNFGNNVGLFGKLNATVNGYYDAINHPKGRQMKGIGMLMEGIENNPMFFELFYDLPWYKTVNLQEWLDLYAFYRYGKFCVECGQAWKILAQTVYDCPTIQEGTSESIFCARPDSVVSKVSCCSVVDLYYNPAELQKAAALMLQVANKFKGNDNFEYDLVDIVRQCITNKGLQIYNLMMDAYMQQNIEQFEDYKKQFLELILDQDKLLSTRKEFMLAHWLQMAKDKAANKEERQLYEWNAKTIITTWGNRTTADDAGLKDYSHREWNGMLKDFYFCRWQMYLDALSCKLNNKIMPNIDYYAWEQAWCNQKKQYQTKPACNLLQITNSIYNKHFK